MRTIRHHHYQMSTQHRSLHQSHNLNNNLNDTLLFHRSARNHTFKYWTITRPHCHNHPILSRCRCLRLNCILHSNMDIAHPTRCGDCRCKYHKSTCAPLHVDHQYVYHYCLTQSHCRYRLHWTYNLPSDWNVICLPRHNNRKRKSLKISYACQYACHGHPARSQHHIGTHQYNALQHHQYALRSYRHRHYPNMISHHPPFIAVQLSLLHHTIRPSQRPVACWTHHIAILTCNYLRTRTVDLQWDTRPVRVTKHHLARILHQMMLAP
jgi:hypothetical protein